VDDKTDEYYPLVDELLVYSRRMPFVGTNVKATIDGGMIEIRSAR